MLRAHRMKSDETPLLLPNLCDFLRKKMVQVVIDRYFSLFLKSFEDFFFYPRLSLIVPLSLDIILCEPLTSQYDMNKKEEETKTP